MILCRRDVYKRQATNQITPNMVQPNAVLYSRKVHNANGVYEPASNKYIEQWSNTWNTFLAFLLGFKPCYITVSYTHLVLIYFSFSATFSSSCLIFICWGQTCSHLPHFIHSEAFLNPWPLTSQSSWCLAAPMSLYRVK